MELIELIKKHKEKFVESVKFRCSTSTNNKSKHLRMLAALSANDWKAVDTLIKTEYRIVLEGVIYCMFWHDSEENMGVKIQFVNAYDKAMKYD